MPSALLTGERPDPVRVISAICQQHGSWMQPGQEHRTEPIVMGLAGREAKVHRQAISIHDGVYLGGKPASRTAHVLLSIGRNAGPVLVHAHDRRIDHLHRRIMSGGQRIHDLVPDAGPAPANEAIVTSRMGTVVLRQIAPRRTCRKTQKIPLRMRRSSTRGMPRGLFGSIGLMTLHSQSLSSYRMIRSSGLGA